MEVDFKVEVDLKVEVELKVEVDLKNEVDEGRVTTFSKFQYWKNTVLYCIWQKITVNLL